MVSATVPGPDPLPADVTVTHEDPFTTFHAQPVPAETVTFTLPPIAGTEAVEGESV